MNQLRPASLEQRPVRHRRSGAPWLQARQRKADVCSLRVAVSLQQRAVGFARFPVQLRGCCRKLPRPAWGRKH